MNGIVRNIIPKKNFGFIEGEERQEYFFHRDDFNGHWNDLEVDLNKNKIIKVEFTPETGAKGPRAAKVSRMDWPNQSPG